MKKVLAIVLALAFSLATVAGIAGCAGTAQDSTHYTHSENDGHLHEYIHKLHPDEYVCQLCGKVYDGDPANLREF